MTRIELITFHALELLDLIGAQPGGGTLTLQAGDESVQFDLEDLCLSIAVSVDDDDDDDILPFGRN